MTKKPTLADLEQQIADLTDALQRERADAMNVRRRSDEERSKMAGFYKSLVVRELLPTIDNFERALKHAPPVRHPELVSGSSNKSDEILKQVQDDVKKYDDYIKGIQGVVKQFEDALKKIGVERIKTVGEHFDPNLHEAVAMEEGEGKDEIVSEELQSGYILGDEVIRHAMVKVTMR